MFSLSNMRQYLPFCVSMIPSISIPSVLLTTAAMLVGTLFHELLAVSKKLIPRRLFEKIFSKLKSLIQNYHSEMTLIIDEYVNGLSVNEMFEASEIYLRRKIGPSVERLKISKAPGEEEICVSINQGEKMMDTFEGVQLTWRMRSTKHEETKIDNRGRPFQETVERRSIELKFHKKYREKLPLSVLLNFVDGLWSSCGDQKIIIFTTNHKDRLDPALLRPGRMDMHIHMSYCTPCGFKILASNYLGIKDHSMFSEIEKLVTEVEVTAAEIAEELMKSDEADIALEGLSKFIRTKKTEHDKANAEGKKEVNEQAEKSPGNKEGAEKESEEN